MKNFIFVSTAATIGFGSIETPDNESNHINPISEKSYYARSKLEAEKILAHYQNKINIANIHPTFLIEPYDSKPSSGKLSLMGLKKSFIFYFPGGKNFVHVRDVTAAIRKVLEHTK